MPRNLTTLPRFTALLSAVLAAVIPAVSLVAQVNFGEYEQVLQVVARLKGRTDPIKALKLSGAVLGTEHGLLNTVPARHLSTAERDLLAQENQDRRKLFEFISKYADPPVSYERVANEYAKNIWREWPPSASPSPP